MNVKAVAVLVYLAAFRAVALADVPPSAESPTIRHVDPPINIVRSWMAPLNDNVRYVTCISFVNTSSKVVTAFRVNMSMLDGSGNAQGLYNLDRAGQFSPGVLIEGPLSADEYNLGTQNGPSLFGVREKMRNCWTAQINGIPSGQTLRLTTAIFADGSSWKP